MKKSEPPKEDRISISFPALKLVQPIGEFYVGVISAKKLCEITYFDVRRVIQRERDIERYLGIQRPLDDRRVEELEQYVNTIDATFPTAVIIAVDEACASFDEKKGELTLSNLLGDESAGAEPIYYRRIARVIDGQHRIAGLFEFEGQDFEVNVTIFIGMDIADQAYVFSTVNLAQTKVNKSLAYDLFDLAKARSPQKTCHNIAVALDRTEKSPFFKRIKRLGVATEGRFGETVTQQQIVEGLLRYISTNPMSDRDLYLRGRVPDKVGLEEAEKLIFRNMFIDERDLEIGRIMFEYFSAVQDRWSEAWDSTGKGFILNRTNGFRALMRFLRYAYLHFTAPGGIVRKEQFAQLFKECTLKDDEFTTKNFDPGSSGESALFRRLMSDTKVAA